VLRLNFFNAEPMSDDDEGEPTLALAGDIDDDTLVLRGDIEDTLELAGGDMVEVVAEVDDDDLLVNVGVDVTRGGGSGAVKGC